ncbi:MAG: hypothetical protein U1F76_07060 [Candidatus Competibacteraceae bacterium]
MTELLTPLQVDLLRAAFLRHPDALPAWRRWRDSIAWNQYVDPEVFALLPVVYRNLHGLGADDPLFPRFKGIARQAWLANQRWIAELQDTLVRCAEEGVELLALPPTQQLLGDPAVVQSYRRQLALAVRPEQAERAVRCLLHSGWRAARVQLPSGLVAGYVRGTRYLLLKNAKRDPLMLAWGLEWWFDDSAASVWRRARRQSLGKQPIRGLDPGDALAFVLRRSLAETSFGRIAEALAIAVGTELMPWDRLCETFGRHPLPTERLTMLAILQPFFDRRGLTYRLRQWCGESRTESRWTLPAGSPLVRYGRDWQTYRQAWGDSYHPAMALLQLPGYLMGRWQLSSPAELPRGLARWLYFKGKDSP